MRWISLFSLSLILLSAERLMIEISDTKIYETEPIIAKLSFDSDENSSANRLESRGFRAEDFEIVKLDSNISSHKKGQYIYRSLWLLKPKKRGTLIIPPQKVVIYRLDRSSYLTLPKEYETEPILVQVKSLPKDALFAGDITIKAKADTTRTEPNKPVTVSVVIEGSGDLSLIPPFNPQIDDAVVFPSSVKITSSVIDGKYITRWVEQIGYSSDKDFTIAPFKIRYLNSTTGSIEVVESEPIAIDVKVSVALKRWLIYISLVLLGVVIALVATVFYHKRVQKEQSDIVVALKRAKSDKEIYNLLLPYSNDRDISKWISKLEDNIYSGKSHKIDKRSIISLLSKDNFRGSNP